MSNPDLSDLPAHGRVIGLDPGTVRIGLALSDGLRLAAHAHVVLDANARDLMEAIEAIVDEYGVTVGVVGLPTSLDGSDTPSTAVARSFAERVDAALDIPIVLYDERFSSKIAERALLSADTSRAKRKQSIDRVAAAVMLQGFLDRLTAQR